MPYHHNPTTLEQHLANFQHQEEKTRAHLEQAVKSQTRIDFDTLAISLTHLQIETEKLRTVLNSVLGE